MECKLLRLPLLAGTTAVNGNPPALSPARLAAAKLNRR